MYNRHNEVPVFEHRQTQVQALHYHHVQHALRHRGPSIELHLPALRSLKLILQADAWIIVDEALGELPVAAWCDFQARGRQNLQQPVPCTLRLFHSHAGLVLDRVLEAMELMLGEQLQTQGEATILPFGKKE